MNHKESYRVIGTQPVRIDALDKVTGRAIYGTDVNLPGLLHGKMLRSPHAHARIHRINTSQAEALPGVHAVVTAGDLPKSTDQPNIQSEEAIQLKYLRDNILARDKVLYEGHAVAAVAAVSPHVAEDATNLIQVEYEPLPVVLDVFEALRNDAPLLHEDLRTHSLGPENGRLSNLANHLLKIRGDPDKGFAEADVIVEREFRTSMVHQGYLEPHAATAQWNLDGTLTLWSSTQGAFGVRDRVAQILDLPLSRIHVIPTEVGGAFGGKILCYLDPVAALLSRRAGRPVKMIMTRAEVFRGSGPAPANVIRIKMGANRQGRITAAKAELYREDGGYPCMLFNLDMNCRIFGPYDITNGQIDGYNIVVNKPHVSAYRAPGGPQVAFASELVVDELAQRIGIDPLEFRMLNVAKEGTQTIDGYVHRRTGAPEVLKAAHEHPHYRTPVKGANRGRGVAIGHWRGWGGQSSCTISVNADGSVTLLTGSVDLTGSRTSLAMQAAEVLGLGIDQVWSSVGDTDSIGYTAGSEGSRTTFATGLAVIEAARDVLAQMIVRVALLLGVPAETISYDDGKFTTNQDPSKVLIFRQVAAILNQTGGPITGKGNIDAQGWGAGFGCHIVDVEVDPLTGKVTVLRYTVVQDVGKAIHRALAEGQIRGGVAQGIGWALWEGYLYDKQGRLLNPNWLDYKQPTTLDIPKIDIVLVEVPGPNHPFGVRGVAEASLVPSLPAVASAVSKATKCRVERLPMTPEHILQMTGVI